MRRADDVDVARALQRLQHDPERRDAHARDGDRRSLDAGEETAQARQGRHAAQRAESAQLAAEHADVRAPQRAAVQRGAEIGVVLEVDLHDHGLDEDLAPRDVEPLDQLDQVAPVGLAGDHHQRIRVLVGGDLYFAGRRRFFAAGKRLQRGRQVLGLRVLQRVDVHGAVAGGDVELPEQVADRRERFFRGDHDQFVGSLVGEDLPRFLLLRLQDLAELLRQVLRRGMLHGDDADLLRAARLIELLDQLLQPPQIEAQLGDDQRIGREDLQIGIARGELREHVAHLLRLDVAELEELGDHLLGGRRFLAIGKQSGNVLLLGQLPVAADRIDGPVVGVECGEEDAPDLVGGDRRVGKYRDLSRDPLGQDEVAVGELADELDHLRQLALVERHQHRLWPRRGGEREQDCQHGLLVERERGAHRPRAVGGRCARCRARHLLSGSRPARVHAACRTAALSGKERSRAARVTASPAICQGGTKWPRAGAGARKQKIPAGTRAVWRTRW